MRNQTPTSNNHVKWIVPVAVVVLVIAIYAGVTMYNKRGVSNSNEVVNSNNINIETSVATNTSPYKDGTYNAVGNYTSPGGRVSIDVTLSVKNGVVETVSLVPKATSPTSEQYVSDFVAHYKPLVVGKNLSTLNLSKVSGSSLTSKGFNAAIELIKAQAKA